MGPALGCLLDLWRLHGTGFGLVERRRETAFAAVWSLRRGHGHQRPRALEDVVQGGVHLGRGQALGDALEQGQVLGRRGFDLLLVDRAHQFIGQVGRAAGGGAGHGVAQRHLLFGDLAVNLGLGEAILQRLPLHLHRRVQGRAPGLGLERDAELGQVSGAVQLAHAGGGAQERWVGRMGDAGVAPVQRRQGQVADHVAPLPHRGVRGGVEGADPVDGDRGRGAVAHHQLAGRPARGGAAQVGRRGLGADGLPVGEAGLDLLRHGGRIDVAGDHQGGAVGSVVGAVEVLDQVHRRGLDDLHLADGHAVGGELALELEGVARLVDFIVRRIAQPLFRQHHPALGLQRLGLEQQVAADLAQQQQALANGLGVVVGQVELVDRLGHAGAGVGVGAEGQAQPLQDLDRLVGARGVGRALEGHVLQHVGQALLVVALLQRARADAQAQRHLALGGLVVLDGVAHAVGQHAEGDGRIGRQVAVGVGPDLVALGQGRGWGRGGRRLGQGRERETESGAGGQR